MLVKVKLLKEQLEHYDAHKNTFRQYFWDNEDISLIRKLYQSLPPDPEAFLNDKQVFELIRICSNLRIDKLHPQTAQVFASLKQAVYSDILSACECLNRMNLLSYENYKLISHQENPIKIACALGMLKTYDQLTESNMAKLKNVNEAPLAATAIIKSCFAITEFNFNNIFTFLGRMANLIWVLSFLPKDEAENIYSVLLNNKLSENPDLRPDHVLAHATIIAALSNESHQYVLRVLAQSNEQILQSLHHDINYYPGKGAKLLWENIKDKVIEKITDEFLLLFNHPIAELAFKEADWRFTRMLIKQFNYEMENLSSTQAYFFKLNEGEKSALLRSTMFAGANTPQAKHADVSNPLRLGAAL